MTKLEETFNLPQIKKEVTDIKKAAKEEEARAIIDPADVLDHDEKMDEYADTAFDYAKHIFELGMDVEARHGAEMFNAAASLMKVAVDSKNGKIEKKLKMAELELKRQKLEYETKKGGTELLPEGLMAVNRKDLLDKYEDL